MANPLLISSQLPYQLPPFAEIRVEHYRPAFTESLSRHNAEIAAIVDNSDSPTWVNTVEALERSGRDLERVMSVFGNLSGTDITDEMEEIAADIYPELSAHMDAIYQNEKLYERLKSVEAPEDTESSACTIIYCVHSSARARSFPPKPSSACRRLTSVCPRCLRILAAI